jgi:uncharacterized membrane protein
MKNQKRVRFLVESAMIAAVYAVTTYICAAFNLAYGPVQFRFSEALTVLSALTPAAIPGLTLGCIISNIGSPMGIIDVVFGSVATLLAAVFGWLCRNIKIKQIPLLSIIYPVIFNGIIIGAEIIFMLSDEAPTFTAFLINGGQVALGELAVCLIGGIPLYLGLKRTKLFTGSSPKSTEKTE